MSYEYKAKRKIFICKWWALQKLMFNWSQRIRLYDLLREFLALIMLWLRVKSSFLGPKSAERHSKFISQSTWLMGLLMLKRKWLVLYYNTNKRSITSTKKNKDLRKTVYWYNKWHNEDSKSPSWLQTQIQTSQISMWQNGCRAFSDRTMTRDFSEYALI